MSYDTDKVLMHKMLIDNIGSVARFIDVVSTTIGSRLPSVEEFTILYTERLVLHALMIPRSLEANIAYTIDAGRLHHRLIQMLDEQVALMKPAEGDIFRRELRDVVSANNDVLDASSSFAHTYKVAIVKERQTAGFQIDTDVIMQAKQDFAHMFASQSWRGEYVDAVRRGKSIPVETPHSARMRLMSIHGNRYGCLRLHA